ncbi:hypothetical protein [Streptomyces sp. NPDC051662]|uniref:hypothetical protein n=1 Tax=Streptomyces sp. NPDC051662 TaxID=3154750 RepID=UPI00343A24D6
MPTPPLDVPAEATRVRIRQPAPQGDLFFLSAADVDAYAPDVDPARGQTIESAAGPQLLHTDSRFDVGGTDVSVWSDGLLVGVSTHAPHSLRMDQDWESSGRRPRRLDAVGPLLVRILRAENLAALDPDDWWMTWLDARDWTEQPGTQVDRVDRALAADVSAWRTLSTIRHRITRADGTTAELFEARSQTSCRDADPFRAETRAGHGMPLVSRRSFHATEALALEVLEMWRAEQAGHPPLVTRAEAAALCDTTPQALAQALSRAARTPRTPGTVPHPKPLATLSGGHWLDPRRCVLWWESRPGHGPGRGHKTPVS